MSTSQHTFVAEQYSPRAEGYVTSLNHSSGDDLYQIETELNGYATARVLDLGCGGGHVSYCAAPHVAAVVAVDLTRSMLDAVARTRVERSLSNFSVQHAAAERLPFQDSSFDVVLCRFTTHHWHDMEAGLCEARRVLKPSGRAIFIDSVTPADLVLDTHLQAIELLRDGSHVRNYSIAEWVAALQRSCFAIASAAPAPARQPASARAPQTGTCARTCPCRAAPQGNAGSAEAAPLRSDGAAA